MSLRLARPGELRFPEFCACRPMMTFLQSCSSHAENLGSSSHQFVGIACMDISHKLPRTPTRCSSPGDPIFSEVVPSRLVSTSLEYSQNNIVGIGLPIHTLRVRWFLPGASLAKEVASNTARLSMPHQVSTLRVEALSKGWQ